MRFAILGPIELRHGDLRAGVGAPQQVTLLAYLLLHANHAVSVDGLHDALWPSRGHEGAHNRVQMAIARLRRNLAPLDGDAGPLRTVSGGYLLAVGPDELDAQVFADRVTDGRALLEGGDPAGASRVLHDALALWRGPPLAEVAFKDFAQSEIRRLDELRLMALESRIDAELELGRHGDTVGELRALVAEHPGRERLCGQLMLALYRCGRQGDALEAYSRMDAHLLSELGLRPGPALQALQRAVLEQAPSLDCDGDEAARSKPARAEAVAAAQRESFVLPPALALREGEPLVGRAAATEQIAAAYEQAALGARRAVVLCGEPGIGKTRLAQEVAYETHAAGAIVLYGRCDEEPLLPHQPFVEALRHYVGHCPRALLAGQVSLVSGELRRMVPELAERVPALALPLAGDPEGARHRLFEAVAALLCEAAQQRPVVLVLDDLHWADEATLLLLKYLARYPRQSKLLIVATYRDTDIGPGHRLSSVLADLGRERLAERVPLGRLDATAVAELVGWHTSDRASTDLRRMVFAETQGLAFFVVEVARHLSDADRDDDHDLLRAPGSLPLPEGVRDLVGRRLGRLGARPSRVLETAAVLGHAFAFEVLAHTCDLGEADVVDALERAVGAQLVDEPASGDDRHSFSHALIRDVLYRSLSRTRRRLLHRRAADAIQATAVGGKLASAELAHHLVHAGAAKDLDRAVECLASAAEQALALLAYEQAATRLREALGLLDAGATASLQRRCDLVIALGEAQRQAGDPAYRETLLHGAVLAQQIDDRDRLARAALANNRGLFSASTGVDHQRISVLKHALGVQLASDSTTRASLLAHLAVELVADPDWFERLKISDEALAMARRIGDPLTLLRTLNYRFVALWGPRTATERMANSREAHELAEQLKDPVLAFQAAAYGAHAAMEAGDLQLADRLLASSGELAEQLGQPIIQWYFAIGRAKRTAISASLEEAERLAHQARQVGRSAGQPDAEGWSAIQIFVIRFLQGALDGDRPNFLQAAQAATGLHARFQGSRSIPLLTEATHIVTLCEVGRVDDARPRFDEFMHDGLSDVPHDWAALAIPTLASVACAHLRDVPRAEALYAMLEPHSSQFIDSGPTWLGATNHYLALLAATLGRFDEADAHFSQAADQYAALGAEPWLIRARLDSDRVSRSQIGG